MPRKSRIDAPGALHHIIARGIDRRKIFKNDGDRDHFLSRLGDILTETKTACYAWALIPNHFHLLLRTSNVSISTTMRRLLTGYAMWYNRKPADTGTIQGDVPSSRCFRSSARESLGDRQAPGNRSSSQPFVLLGSQRVGCHNDIPFPPVGSIGNSYWQSGNTGRGACKGE